MKYGLYGQCEVQCKHRRISGRPKLPKLCQYAWTWFCDGYGGMRNVVLVNTVVCRVLMSVLLKWWIPTSDVVRVCVVISESLGKEQCVPLFVGVA